MPPFEIRDALLKHLRAVRNGSFKPEAANTFDGMSDAEKEEAGRTLINVNLAIRKLENVQLATIADDLKQFEGDLTDATAKLNGALQNLRKFKQVLDATTSVLKLLARIAKLVGIPIPV